MSTKSFAKTLGLVGKPNTGKSTFFSAATLIPVEIGSYPFTTIKPNRGIGFIRTRCVCKEFDVEDTPRNSLCMDGIRLVPVEIIDCAGLVPGAWRGRGLGNQFLDEIRKADALIHIVDIAGATDAEGKLCRIGSHNPLEDVHFLETEITMWMNQIVKRDWLRMARTSESGREDLYSLIETRLSGLGIMKPQIMAAIRKTKLNAEKPTCWSDNDLIAFLNELRNVSKPLLIAANKYDLPNAQENADKLRELGYLVIACCAEAELALRRAAEKKLIEYRPGDPNFKVVRSEDISEAQRKALNVIQDRMLAKCGSTGVQDAINEAFFKLLKMIVVYPVEDIEHLSDHNGLVLPDAYLVPSGTTTRQLAYMIHTDLGESFIYAIEAHQKKRIGEDYVLKDGDVVSIVSATKRR